MPQSPAKALTLTDSQAESLAQAFRPQELLRLHSLIRGISPLKRYNCVESEQLSGEIRELRKLLGLTQHQLAEELRLNPLTISFWERQGSGHLPTRANLQLFLRYIKERIQRHSLEDSN